MAKVVLLFLLSFTLPAWADFSVPRLTGPVVDQAGMLSPRTERGLSQLLRKLYVDTGTQINVLTVTDMSGITIEQATIKVVDQWKLGTGKEDKGLLLMVAKKERRTRIEVGQGLEGDLPDIYAKRIVSDQMRPLFKAGEFDRGVVVAVLSIIERTNPKFKVNTSIKRSPARRKKAGLFQIIFFIAMFVLSIFSRSFRGMLFLGLASGLGRGGGFGGGGGGGWSGGGGGFSGGGASGGW